MDLTNINQIFLIELDNLIDMSMTPFYLTVSCFVPEAVSAYFRDKHFIVFPPRSTAHSSTIPIFFKFYIFLPFRACFSLVKSVFCLLLLTILNVLPSLSFYSKDEKKAIRFFYFFYLVIQIHFIPKALKVLS